MKKIIIAISVALLIFLGVFYFLQIQNVKVEGGRIYSDQEIIDRAMSDSLSYHTIYFFVRSKLRGVPCLPFTQEIDVEWSSPVSITLHVYDKTISGCVKYMGQYIYFDKDGIVLQSLSEPMDSVPVVTGIKFGKFTINEAFDVEDDTLFDTIMNLSGLIHHYKLDVEQISFQDKDVTIYSGKVQVHLGKKSFYDDDLAALSSVLKKTAKKGISGTIDMEHFVPGNRIVVKTNEAVLGTAGKQEDTGADQTGEDAGTEGDPDGTVQDGEGETASDDGSAEEGAGQDAEGAVSESEETVESEQIDDTDVSE